MTGLVGALAFIAAVKFWTEGRRGAAIGVVAAAIVVAMLLTRYTGDRPGFDWV